jgi:hypothetical protein
VVVNAQHSTGSDPIAASNPSLDGILWCALQAVAPPS